MSENQDYEQIIIEKAPEQWAEDAFSEASLGDKRRVNRLIDIASDMIRSPGASFLAGCEGDSAKLEGTYRWLENDAVDYTAVLEAGCQSARRWLGEVEGDVLAVSDTTSLGYEHGLAKALGDLGGGKKDRRRGLFVHSVLLLLAGTGENLGLGDQVYWQRADADRGKGRDRKERDSEEKESFKWEYAVERVLERFPEFLRRFIFVSDRESDIYELFRYFLGHDLRSVVRASWNRRLDRREEKLFEQAASAPDMGEVMIYIPPKGGRPPHWACVRVRACTVTLSAPLRDSALPPLTFNVVQAEELAADNPMTWTLLTTEPIGTFDQVLYVLSCYGLRWKIEDFHKCWKSGGTNVEGLKLQSRESLLRAAVVLAFVAQRLMQLRDEVDPEPAGSLSRMYISADFADQQADAPSSPSFAEASGSRISIPERPCSDVLSRLEWQVLWLIVEKGRALPPEVPNRRWAYRTIGRLAGWTDTKHTGKMSVKTSWRGYFTLRERVDAVRLAQLAGIKVQNEL